MFRRLAPTTALILTLALTSQARAATLRAELPRQVTVAGRKLQLNGQHVFRKWFFRLYTVGLYLERPSSDAHEILASNRTKRLQIRVLRAVRGEQIASLLRWRLETVAADQPELRAEFEKFFAQIPDVKAGTDFNITYVPGVGTRVNAGGKQVLLHGKQYADALLKIWIGDDEWAGKTRGDLLRQPT